MKCNFLSTVDEDVECYKECELYRWPENNNKCPFTQLKGRHSKNKQIFDYDNYRSEDDIPISMLYDEDEDYI